MTTIEISHFNDFLAIARRQSEPQQLLMVFTRRELPQGCTPEQEALFNEGSGGHLAPVVCVDKAPTAFSDFQTLKNESHQTVQNWDVVFIAALPARNGKAPVKTAIDEMLDVMVEQIKNGRTSAYLAFDAQGEPLQLTSAG